MSLKTYLQRIRFIDKLIGKRATGNQKCLASKVGLSQSAINQYLNEMKEEGFPIKYSRKANTYYYEKDGKMVSALFSEELDREKMKNSMGGLMPLPIYL